MKRAILVSSGTLAGLVAVLTYSGGDTIPVAAAAGAGGRGLGGPPPLGAGDPTTAAPAAGASGASGATGAAAPAASTPAPAASSAAPAKPAAPSAAPTKPAATPAAAPTKAAAPAATPVAKPTPAPTKAAAPKPTPTKPAVPAGPKDYVGSLQTHKYGQVQVGIRVQGGKIIAVWPVVYPNGPSQPYSDFSIPVLQSETLAAQSASIANVSGATLTWQSWESSLQSALSQAGL